MVVIDRINILGLELSQNMMERSLAVHVGIGDELHAPHIRERQPLYYNLIGHDHPRLPFECRIIR